jgi:hypothetical protein
VKDKLERLVRPDSGLELTAQERREYNRCLDGLMRQSHAFDPSEDQKKRAMDHVVHLSNRE